MAAPTITVTVRASNHIGQLLQVFGTLSLSATYATAGDLFDPTQFGMAILRNLQLSPGTDGAGATPGTHAIIAKCTGFQLDTAGATVNSAYDLAGSHAAAQGKIQAFWCAGSGAALVEVTATTDLHLYTFDFVALGSE